MKKPAWKLYYDDGSTFSSSDGRWSKAPAWGVLAVVTPDPYVGREIDTGDFYVYWKGAKKPWGVDPYGALDYLIQHGHLDEDTPMSSLTGKQLVKAGMKMGRSLDNERWRELWNRVVEDADSIFSPKDGTRKTERVPSPEMA